jgi:sugar phosphate isomerase/epimerase
MQIVGYAIVKITELRGAHMITMFDWVYYDLPVRERFRLMRQAGFNGVTLWWGDAFGGSAPLARAEGLHIENIHGPYWNNSDFWLDIANGDDITEYHMQCIQNCADFSIPVMVVHLTSGDVLPPCGKTGLDRVLRITEKAEQCGINVALENLSGTEHLAYVLSRIDSPRIGFCFDSGHQNCHTPDEDVLLHYGCRLMALHLHDNAGTGGEGDTHLLPFDGTTDWNAVMRKITGTGFSGALGLEASNTGYEDFTAEAFYTLAYERAAKLSLLQ